jgi:sugar lactone lactonase YvrE
MGYSQGVGMALFKDTLYALGSINRQKRSKLYKINISNNELIKSYALADDKSSFFNDLAIDQNQNAYITDTEFHKIYKYNYNSGTIDLFLENDAIKYPNGITISKDQSKLFVDSYFTGIRIIDLGTKEILNDVDEFNKNIGIDGLNITITIYMALSMVQRIKSDMGYINSCSHQKKMQLLLQKLF